MTDPVRACIDRVMLADRVMDAADRSIAENPANAPIPPLRVPPGSMAGHPFSMAIVTGAMWPKVGRELSVSFLDGDPAVQARIPEYAEVCSEYANITFSFGSDADADIRISFKDPGSWSWIGTQCFAIPALEPTMNYGWLTPDTDEQEYSRVVTHEFGHAVGCVHELQNPARTHPIEQAGRVRLLRRTAQQLD
jgi:hypothetical protein